MKTTKHREAEKRAAVTLNKIFGYKKPKPKKRIIDPDEMICSKCKVKHSISISNYKLNEKHYCGGIFRKPYEKTLTN